MLTIKHLVRRLCLFAIQLLVFCWGSVLYAADMDFQVNTGVGYDSNVFRSANDPEKDVYFTLAPKVALALPFYRTYFGSSLSAVLEQHVNRTDANLLELIFSGVGRYNLSDYMSFGLRDELVVSDRLRSAEELTDVARRREFVDNRLSSDLRHELREDVLTASLEYANTIRDYKHTERDGWRAHSGQLRIEYSLGYKTSTQASLGLIRKVYEGDADYVSVPVAASVKRRLSDKLDASFSLGLENRRYNEAFRDSNWDEPSLSLDVTGRFTPKTASRLSLQRRVYDSDLSIGHTFVSKAGILTLVLNLSDAAQLLVKGLYSRNDYLRFKWTNNVFEGYGAIQYRLVKWGAVVLGYGYEKWNSNFLDILDYDYDKHVVDISYAIIF